MPNRINTAITSFGMSGQVFHGPLLVSNPDFKVTKILERSKELSKHMFPEATIARQFDEILTDPEIELVVINTPDHTHYEMCKQALEADKNVVVEKPFTQSVSQGEELIELAKQRKVMLSVFQNRRWDGDYMTVQHIIQNKYLGELKEFEAHFDRYRRKTNPYTWKENPTHGTGTLYNLGSHLIDQALTIFGMPESVTADIDILRSNGKVDDYFNLWLHYKDLKVTLKGTYLAKEPLPRYTLHGTHGSFLKYGLDPQEEALKNGGLPTDMGWGLDKEENYGTLNSEMDGLHFRGKIETLAGSYQLFYENIYDVIRNKKELMIKPEEALNVIKIIKAAQKSAVEKRAISL